MNPVLKSLLISTVLVIAYPIAVLVVLTVLGILSGGASKGQALEALMMPMSLPRFVMRSLHPFGAIPSRPVMFLLVWVIAFNATLYYVPVRLFLEWREQKIRLR